MLTLSKSMPVIIRRENEIDDTKDAASPEMNILHSLTKQIKRLELCQEKILKLEKLARCDVEPLVDALLHNMNETDKKMYQTGIEFMKNTVSGILSNE